MAWTTVKLNANCYCLIVKNVSNYFVFYPSCISNNVDMVKSNIASIILIYYDSSSYILTYSHIQWQFVWDLFQKIGIHFSVAYAASGALDPNQQKIIRVKQNAICINYIPISWSFYCPGFILSRRTNRFVKDTVKCVRDTLVFTIEGIPL